MTMTAQVLAMEDSEPPLAPAVPLPGSDEPLHGYELDFGGTLSLRCLRTQGLSVPVPEGVPRPGWLGKAVVGTRTRVRFSCPVSVLRTAWSVTATVKQSTPSLGDVLRKDTTGVH
jgi:hypothetical protein